MSESVNCPKCDRVCKDRRALAYHEKNCKGPGEFRCPDSDCGKTFTAKTSLIRHIQTCKAIKNKKAEKQQESEEEEEQSEQDNDSSINETPVEESNTTKRTYVKFTHAIEYALLPRFKEWIHLSFYDFGRRLGSEIKAYYRVEPKSREENYILIRDDSGQYASIHLDELQEYISKAVSSSLFNGETNGIVVYVLRECSIFKPEDVQRYLNYFDDPTEEQTLEIMRGMVNS
jgi:hypothetical protein